MADPETPLAAGASNPETFQEPGGILCLTKGLRALSREYP